MILSVEIIFIKRSVLIFAGFFIKKNALAAGLRWLVQTSFAHYTFEGSLISLYGTVNGVQRDLLNCSVESATANSTQFVRDFNQNVSLECPCKLK